MATIATQEVSHTSMSRVFAVEVIEDEHTYTYTVEVPSELYERITAQSISYNTFIEYVFQFLLSNEKATDILSEFSVADIPNYFPQFEESVRALITRNKEDV